MPQQIKMHRPARLRVHARRDETNRPNASARGYTDKRHRAWRQAVLTRDAWACVMCGRIDQANHADHVLPIASGGARYDIKNGQTLCLKCHSAKTARESRRQGGTHHGGCRVGEPRS